MGEAVVVDIVNRSPGPLLSRYLIVAYFIEAGLILLFVPWSGFWDGNYFADVVPALHVLTRNHYVRGAVSGLGVVNLAAGVADLLALIGLRRT